MERSPKKGNKRRNLEIEYGFHYRLVFNSGPQYYLLCSLSEGPRVKTNHESHIHDLFLFPFSSSMGRRELDRELGDDRGKEGKGPRSPIPF